MDPRRAQVERNAHFTRGPRFFCDGDVVQFEFVIDAGNVIGPRPATNADKTKHAEAWGEFEAVNPQVDDEDVPAPATDDQAQVQGPPAKRAYVRRKPLVDETA